MRIHKEGGKTMYSDTIFCIGDKVTIKGSSEVHTVTGIQTKIYAGVRGNVCVNITLYLAGGLWVSARACTRIETKKKNR